MLTKSGLDFILHVTQYFHGHYEDPGWGQQPLTQTLVAVTIRELASGIQDAGLQKQISAAAEKVITGGSHIAGKT